MANSFYCLSKATTIFLLFHQAAEAQECDDSKWTNGFIFPRAFFVMYSGKSSYEVTESRMKATLGRCGKIEDIADEAFKYFDLLGLDMYAAKRNPYSTLNKDNFVFTPSILDPKSNYRIVSETFYNYAKYRDTRLRYVAWHVYAKSDINGPGLTLPEGHRLTHGIFRFETHGRDFCVRFKTPYPLYRGNDTAHPIVLDLYSEEWGEGIASGMVYNNNGIYDARFTMTFPPEPFGAYSKET